MPTTLLFIILAMGVAGAKLGSEMMAEYVAKFVVDEEEIGISTRNPSMAPGVAGVPGTTVEGGVATVLALAATAPLTSESVKSAPEPALIPDGAVDNTSTETKTAAATGDDDPSEVLLGLIGDTPHPRPDGTIFVSIVTQRVFGLRTAVGERSVVPVTVELPGRVITDPNTATLVQVDEASFVEAVDGKLPYVGQPVKRGDLLARLRPTLTAMARAEIEGRIQAMENEIDLDRKRMARLEEVFFVRYRASKIEAIRVEIAGRQRQLGILRSSLRDRIDLRAKTDGVISRVAAASGQYIEPGNTLFEIVDPSRLWVTASAYDPSIVGRLDKVEALTQDGARLALRFVGGGLTLRNQAVPLQFEIVSPVSGLSVDRPVTVVVQTRDQTVAGVKVPRASLFRTNDGRIMLFERRSAETFMPHHVRTVPVDGSNVLVISELAGSVRVVTSGVAVLSQVR